MSSLEKQEHGVRPSLSSHCPNQDVGESEVMEGWREPYYVTGTPGDK